MIHYCQRVSEIFGDMAECNKCAARPSRRYRCTNCQRKGRTGNLERGRRTLCPRCEQANQNT